MRVAALAAVAALVLGACGSDDEAVVATSTTTLAPLVTATAPPATAAPLPSASAAPSTTAITAPPTVDASVVETTPATVRDTVPSGSDPAVRWSDTAAADLDALLVSVSAGTGTPDVVDRLLGSPIDVPLPDDAALDAALVTIDEGPEGWTTSWRIGVATDDDPAAIEAAVAEQFDDERFASGARVESTLDSGVFVTLNYPATDAGAAAGWSLLGITVGPETDINGPTGRQELELAVEQVTPADEPGIAEFLSGWVREIPLGDDLVFDHFEANLVELSTTALWMNIAFTAPADDFAQLVDFYSNDLSSGALVLDASAPPADLSTLERFNAGFFPTLAGHPLSVTVERDSTTPGSDVRVGFEVRMEPAA